MDFIECALCDPTNTIVGGHAKQPLNVADRVKGRISQPYVYVSQVNIFSLCSAYVGWHILPMAKGNSLNIIVHSSRCCLHTIKA